MHNKKQHYFQSGIAKLQSSFYAMRKSIFEILVSPLGMLKKRSKKPISRMKRSYTVDFAAAQAEDSPKQQSKSSKERLLTPTDEEEDDLESYGELEDIGVPVRRSSNHLVTAIIESSPREQREAGAASVATSEEVTSSRMSSGSLIKPNISEQVKIRETLLTIHFDDFFCRMISLPYQRTVTNLDPRSLSMIMQLPPILLRFLPSLETQVWD